MRLRTVCLVFLALLPLAAAAQLDVVITRSTQRAIPIAIVPLEWRIPLGLSLIHISEPTRPY